MRDQFYGWLLGMIMPAKLRCLEESQSRLESIVETLQFVSNEIVNTKGGVSGIQSQVGEIRSEIAAIRREVAHLKEGETDYQLLMIKQEKLAELKDLDPEFLPVYAACRQYTMTSIERLFSLYKCVEYLTKARIPGDFAECGVWRGGSCMAMAFGLLRGRDSERSIYLFDTYEGHPQPDTQKDSDLWGNRAIDEWQNRQIEEGPIKWGAASLDEVRTNLLSTGYPEARLVLVKGLVENTAAANGPDRLALLRLDTDWYSSTQVALQHLYPRLIEGGVLIIDDYGHYKGQRQAVDEYFAGIGEVPLFHRIDYSGRVMIKR